MEITLTDDQEFFAGTTRKFLGAECPLTRVRALESSTPGFDSAYWRQGAELGWTSLLVPDDLGGGSISGSGVVDLTLVADAFGRHVAPGPLVPANVVAAALARSGTEDQRSELLPGILSGEVTAAWCGHELALGPAGSRVSSSGVSPGLPGDDPVTEGPRAVAADGGYELRGTCPQVEAACEADQLLVTASVPGGLAQFLVPAGTDGVAVRALQSIDLVRRFGRVELDGAHVPASSAVGEVGGAADDVERQLQLALVMQTAEMVGAAEVAFAFTLQWAFDRYSFGRPLASYQELKHRFADMKTWLEASHALASTLAREVQAEADGAIETASAAKAYIGEHLGELMQDCVQMHGGIGLTADHDLHLYLRRVTADRVTYGSPGEHRRRIGALQAREVGV